jgi:hypothetical protein
MKTRNLISIVRATLMAGVVTIGCFTSAPSAAAQTGATFAIVNIPFDFQAATQKMPAGQYRISRGSSESFIVLRGPNQPIAVLTHPGFVSEAPSRGYVVFNRIGDTYFLNEIWNAGSSNGMVCPPGRAQKELLKASMKQAPSQIKLALNSPPQR